MCDNGNEPEIYGDTTNRKILCCDETPSAQVEKHGKKFAIDYYIKIIIRILINLNKLLDTIPINKYLKIKKEIYIVPYEEINSKLNILIEKMAKYEKVLENNKNVLSDHKFSIPSIPKKRKISSNSGSKKVKVRFNNSSFKINTIGTGKVMGSRNLMRYIPKTKKRKVSFNTSNFKINTIGTGKGMGSGNLMRYIAKRKRSKSKSRSRSRSRSSSNNNNNQDITSNTPNIQMKITYTNQNKSVKPILIKTKNERRVSKKVKFNQSTLKNKNKNTNTNGNTNMAAINTVDEVNDWGNLGDMGDMDDMYKAIFDGVFSQKEKI
jgi:hypothetical protein